ncbi:hypothetical protein TPA0906_66650 [Streptomyces olivaceus]|uniref:hypothetical protein n=1 Tax=Streptomyces olivaceus TaxID=47716 RepID=UPI0022EE9671|nr:hypothetical protein [Streptomyces olivaceus]GHJ04800.1 hypothetical protein TPA0906_66650 [Streptomyces olivaceus]
MPARDALIEYAASTRTVTADGLAAYIDRIEKEAAEKAASETRKQAAREIFAEKITETPKGWSERYVAGWNDAIDSATDKVRYGGQP